MNSKEALEILNIAWSGRKDKDGYPNFDDINIALYTIKQDLERLEKLEKEYKESRKVIKSWNKNGGELLRENAKLKKVIEIVNGKTIVIVALKLSKDLNDYIRMTSFENLTQEEYDLLKEYL